MRVRTRLTSGLAALLLALAAGRNRALLCGEALQARIEADPSRIVALLADSPHRASPLRRLQ